MCYLGGLALLKDIFQRETLKIKLASSYSDADKRIQVLFQSEIGIKKVYQWLNLALNVQTLSAVYMPFFVQFVPSKTTSMNLFNLSLTH